MTNSCLEKALKRTFRACKWSSVTTQQFLFILFLHPGAALVACWAPQEHLHLHHHRRRDHWGCDGDSDGFGNSTRTCGCLWTGLIPPTASSSCRRDWGGEGKKIRKATLAMKRGGVLTQPQFIFGCQNKKSKWIVGCWGKVGNQGINRGAEVQTWPTAELLAA